MDRVLRIAVAGVPVMLFAALVILARSMPGYFNNQQYLAGFIFLQLLLVSLWYYDRFFFPCLMIAFLWAGLEIPMAESWNMGRWIVLGVGSVVGFARAMRMGVQRYHPFHLAALFCVASAIVSASVSMLPQLALAKALSLLLLFLYGGSGARLVLQSPDRFFRGLLLGCEISVYVSALSYLVLGWEFWGNANSMGAVEGVVAAPVLLWGTLASSSKGLRLRRAVACLGAIYLVYFSITRAAMFASAFSMMTLLICLRRHKLIMKAVAGAFCVLAITAIATPVRFDEMKTSFVEGVVYKGHQDQGLLGSRLPPWQETMRVIQENPLFGSGFGTSFSGDQPFGEPGRFRSAANTNREHGSSYLAITEWVGLLGIVPFLLLIIFALRNVVKVGSYLRRTGDVTNYSVPLMMVVLAGFLHAGFEDWLFAVGYYLTVFFWVAAFLLADLQPESAAYQTAFVHGMRVRYATAPAMTRQ